MKTATCECGHQETGSTEKDVMTKIESHVHNEHPERADDAKKMIKNAEKTIMDAQEQHADTDFL